MQGSIISPIWFYLIDVLGNAQLVLGFFAIVFVIAVIWTAIAWVINQIELNDWSETSSYYKKALKNIKTCIKCFKIFLPLAIIFSIVVVAIPSKDAMYKMMIAHYVTYENVEIATDVIQDSVDYIAEKFN